MMYVIDRRDDDIKNYILSCKNGLTKKFEYCSALKEPIGIVYKLYKAGLFLNVPRNIFSSDVGFKWGFREEYEYGNINFMTIFRFLALSLNLCLIKSLHSFYRMATLIFNIDLD